MTMQQRHKGHSFGDLTLSRKARRGSSSSVLSFSELGGRKDSAANPKKTRRGGSGSSVLSFSELGGRKDSAADLKKTRRGGSGSSVLSFAELGASKDSVADLMQGSRRSRRQKQPHQEPEYNTGGGSSNQNASWGSIIQPAGSKNKGQKSNMFLRGGLASMLGMKKQPSRDPEAQGEQQSSLDRKGSLSDLQNCRGRSKKSRDPLGSSCHSTRSKKSKDPLGSSSHSTSSVSRRSKTRYVSPKRDDKRRKKKSESIDDVMDREDDDAGSRLSGLLLENKAKIIMEQSVNGNPILPEPPEQHVSSYFESSSTKNDNPMPSRQGLEPSSDEVSLHSSLDGSDHGSVRGLVNYEKEQENMSTHELPSDYRQFTQPSAAQKFESVSTAGATEENNPSWSPAKKKNAFAVNSNFASLYVDHPDMTSLLAKLEQEVQVLEGRANQLLPGMTATPQPAQLPPPQFRQHKPSGRRLRIAPQRKPMDSGVAGHNLMGTGAVVQPGVSRPMGDGPKKSVSGPDLLELHRHRNQVSTSGAASVVAPTGRPIHSGMSAADLLDEAIKVKRMGSGGSSGAKSVLTSPPAFDSPPAAPAGTSDRKTGGGSSNRSILSLSDLQAEVDRMIVEATSSSSKTLQAKQDAKQDIKQDVPSLPPAPQPTQPLMKRSNSLPDVRLDQPLAPRSILKSVPGLAPRQSLGPSQPKKPPPSGEKQAPPSLASVEQPLGGSMDNIDFDGFNNSDPKLSAIFESFSELAPEDHRGDISHNNYGYGGSQNNFMHLGQNMHDLDSDSSSGSNSLNSDDSGSRESTDFSVPTMMTSIKLKEGNGKVDKVSLFPDPLLHPEPLLAGMQPEQQLLREQEPRAAGVEPLASRAVPVEVKKDVVPISPQPVDNMSTKKTDPSPQSTTKTKTLEPQESSTKQDPTSKTSSCLAGTDGPDFSRKADPPPAATASAQTRPIDDKTDHFLKPTVVTNSTKTFNQTPSVTTADPPCPTETHNGRNAEMHEPASVCSVMHSEAPPQKPCPPQMKYERDNSIQAPSLDHGHMRQMANGANQSRTFCANKEAASNVFQTGQHPQPPTEVVSCIPSSDVSVMTFDKCDHESVNKRSYKQSANLNNNMQTLEELEEAAKMGASKAIDTNYYSETTTANETMFTPTDVHSRKSSGFGTIDVPTPKDPHHQRGPAAHRQVRTPIWMKDNTTDSEDTFDGSFSIDMLETKDDVTLDDDDSSSSSSSSGEESESESEEQVTQKEKLDSKHLDKKKSTKKLKKKEKGEEKKKKKSKDKRFSSMDKSRSRRNKDKDSSFGSLDKSRSRKGKWTSSGDKDKKSTSREKKRSSSRDRTRPSSKGRRTTSRDRRTSSKERRASSKQRRAKEAKESKKEASAKKELAKELDRAKELRKLAEEKHRALEENLDKAKALREKKKQQCREMRKKLQKARSSSQLDNLKDDHPSEKKLRRKLNNSLPDLTKARSSASSRRSPKSSKNAEWNTYSLDMSVDHEDIRRKERNRLL